MNNENPMGPQVRQLFETIQEQAKQYNEALRQVDLAAKKYEHLVQELNFFIDKIKDSYDKFTHEQQTLVRKTVHELIEEEEKLKNKYKKLENLDDVKSKMQESLATLEEKFEQIDGFKQKLKDEISKNEETINNFKEKAEKEIQYIVKNNQIVIQNQVKKETDELEKEITFQQRLINGKYSKYDESLQNLQNEVTQKFAKLREIIETLNKRELAIDETMKMSIENRNFIKLIDEKLSEFHLLITNLKKMQKDVLKQIGEEPQYQNTTNFTKDDSTMSEDEVDEIVYDLTNFSVEDEELKNAANKSPEEFHKKVSKNSNKEFIELEKKVKSQSTLIVILFILVVVVGILNFI